MGGAPATPLRRDVLFWGLAAATLALHLRLAFTHGPPYSSPWIMLDEGYRLYPSLRLMRGEMLFRDMFTAYPPFSYYLHWAAFELWGVRVSSVRLVLVGTQLATTLTTYAIGRRMMPRGFALFAALLTVAFGIVRVNMGYAAWYVLPAQLGTIVFLLRWAESGCAARRELVWAGFSAGVALGLKLRDGALVGVAAMVAVTALRTLRDFEPGHGAARRLPSLYALHLSLPALVLLIGRETLTAGRFVLVALPNLAMSAALLVRQLWFTRRVRAAPRRLILDLTALGAGIACVTLPWLIAYGLILSPAVLWHQLVEIPFAMSKRMVVWEVTAEPWPVASLLALGGLGVAAAAILAPERTAQARMLALVGAAAAPTAIVYGWPTLATAGMYVVLPFATGLVLLVAYRHRFDTPPVVDALVVLGVFNGASALSLLPWTDRNHLLWAWLPASLIVSYGASRLFHCLGSWSRALGWCVVASQCALLAVWLRPVATAAAATAGATRLSGSAAFDVAVDPDAARALQPVLDFIDANVPANEFILELPSSFFCFVTGRRQAAKLDYFFVIDGEMWDEEGEIATIRKRSPTYAFLQSWPSAFPKVDAYLRSHYAYHTQLGSVAVLRKRGHD